MKLYELNRGQRFTVLGQFSDEEVFIFDHVDGMYSFCRAESDGRVVNIAAYAEVAPVGRIVDEENI